MLSNIFLRIFNLTENVKEVQTLVTQNHHFGYFNQQ